MRQALNICIWQLSAIFLLTSSPLKLCQLGCGPTDIFRFLQKSLMSSSPGSGWATQGHSQSWLTISHSCCVLRVIVLLEGEPSAQSEVLNALDWVISIFWCIELSFYSYESPSPSGWKTLPHHEAATYTLYTVKKRKEKLSKLKSLRQPASAGFSVFSTYFLGDFWVLNFLLYKLKTTSWENSKVCWSWLP